MLAYVLGLVVDLVAVAVDYRSMQLPTEPDMTQHIPSPIAASRPPAGAPASAPSQLEEALIQLAQSNQRTNAALEHTNQAVQRLAGGGGSLATGGKPTMVILVKLLVQAFTIYLCVSFVLQTKDDFRFIIPYVEFAKQTKGPRAMLLDSSVIIDGRIADIAETRVLESKLLVPKFVLEEIQNIADSSDKLKRNRGRRGLDMLNRLQSNEKIEIQLIDPRVRSVEEAGEVDHKLMALAEHMDARVVTNDYNLNKIAQLRGVEVLNINDLANALKPVVLPGETLTVKIIKPGEEMGQGVGYLDDGTMVVAEQGREHVGQEMTLVVTSVLQTSAGRMIFGRPEGSLPPRPRRT